jgi:glycosyltransferase involved in cell wall biosynthesis
MNVLHVTADYKWTGPAEPMLNGVLGLRALGHQVDVAFPEPPPGFVGGLAERAAARGVSPVLVLKRGRGYLPLRDAGEVRRLRAHLERAHYDVVHVHHTRDHLLCLRALRGLKTALVASWHHGDPMPGSIWWRWLYHPKRLTGLVVLSERLADRASRDLRFPLDRIAVAPGSVDATRFTPREPSLAMREELGIKPGERVAGVVARLQPHRRFDLLLRAYKQVREQGATLRLVVVGRGTRAAQVVDEPVRELGLEDAVIRAGYRRDDYLDVLSVLDAIVFLVPGSDGSCRAVLEAMAMGIPAIASRRGVLPEIVADGSTGTLVDETEESLAAALIDVDRNPPVWRARGEAARTRALEQFPLDRLATELDVLYDRIAQ